MTTIKLKLKEEHYQYLANQASAAHRSVDDLISEIIAADIAWRQTLANDPVAALFGTISDDPEVSDHIDQIVYKLDNSPLDTH